MARNLSADPGRPSATSGRWLQPQLSPPVQASYRYVATVTANGHRNCFQRLALCFQASTRGVMAWWLSVMRGNSPIQNRQLQALTRREICAGRGRDVAGYAVGILG